MTGLLIVDAKSVKNTNSADQGYETGKKVWGIKRHMTVDIQGLLHAIDRRAVNLQQVQCVLVDGGTRVNLFLKPSKTGWVRRRR